MQISMPGIVFKMANMSRFLFIFVWFPFSPAQRRDLKQKHFCWFSLCLFAPKNVYLILLSIFIRLSLRDRPCQTVFGASWATFLTWGFFHLKKKKKNNNFWARVYCNLETELCKRRVKSSLFPVTLSLMKVAKSPGGLKSTVCLCLREHSRGMGGGKVVKLWESRLTERWDREGELWSIVKIEVLRQLRPPDRFQAPTNRCFICVCLPTLL